jgi:hypothetical protein
MKYTGLKSKRRRLPSHHYEGNEYFNHGWIKSEGRNSKSERNPKTEIRNRETAGASLELAEAVFCKLHGSPPVDTDAENVNRASAL